MSSFIAEAVVLNRKKINATDSYITLFTRNMGIIDVYCRNANNAKSPINKGAQPLVFGNFTLNKRGSKRLLDVEIIDDMFSLRYEYELLLDIAVVTKFIKKIIVKSFNSKLIYENFINMLYLVRKNKKYSKKLILYIFVISLKYLGILPSSKCIKCNEKDTYLNIKGEVFCKKHLVEGEYANAKELNDISKIDIITYMKREVNIDKYIEFIKKYYYYHMEIDIIEIEKEIYGGLK